MQNLRDVQLAAQALRNRLPESFKNSHCPPVGIILGTGLSHLANVCENGGRIPFSQLPGFPLPGVESHAGAFIFGFLEGMPVLAQQGRSHLYEGKTPAQVCMGVRVMGMAGVKNLLLTNAAGALNPLFQAGEVMLMSDIINHTGQSPLTGANQDDWGERFPDMSAAFDPELAQIARNKALELGIRLEEGVYIGVRGPEMETPAETRMYRQWGADAIGMSTALEVIAARHMGMKILGFSCLSNKNLPDCPQAAPIAEVIRVAGLAGEKLARLLPPILREMREKECKA